MEEQRPTFNNVYAIFTHGGGINTTVSTEDKTYHEHKDGEFVVHCDDNRQVWVLLFEDTDSAHKVVLSYIDATGNDNVEVKPTLATSIEDHHNVRLYRWDGTWEDITRDDYMKRLAD